MLVGYVSGESTSQNAVDMVVAELDVGAAPLFLTHGRMVARCIETVLLVDRVYTWIEELAGDLKRGEFDVYTGEQSDPGPGRLKVRQAACTRRRAALSAAGSRSKTRRSSTTRLSSPRRERPFHVLPMTRGTPGIVPDWDVDRRPGDATCDLPHRSLLRSLRGLWRACPEHRWSPTCSSLPGCETSIHAQSYSGAYSGDRWMWGWSFPTRLRPKSTCW